MSRENVIGKRPPVSRSTLGVLGSLAVVGVVVLALLFPSIPFIRGGYDYSAMFTEAGGLKSGDAVILSGETVGKVDDLKIVDGLVEIDFHAATNVVLPDRTRAEIKVLTLLGRKALALLPAGRGAMTDGDVIPKERTVAPFDVTEALDQLTRTGQQIDSDRLAQAADSLADMLGSSSDELGPALTGLNRLSGTIASRDQALRELLERARRVTGLLAGRHQEITTLIRDGNELFAELRQRFDLIRQLLISTTQVSDQLQALVEENRATIGPTLQQLQEVLDLLIRNRDNLAATLTEAIPFIQGLGEAVSSGPFFQVYVQNLVPYDLKPDVLPRIPALPGPAGTGSAQQPVPPVVVPGLGSGPAPTGGGR